MGVGSFAAVFSSGSTSFSDGELEDGEYDDGELGDVVRCLSE